MFILTILITILFTFTMATNEDLLEIIKEQQKQIDFLIEEVKNKNTIKKKELKHQHFQKIANLILEKTSDSFRIPNNKNKNPDVDYEKGIKYIIERKKSNIISDIEVLYDKPIVNPNVYYEIKFYVYSTIPEFSYLPIYDETNSIDDYGITYPETSNIFNVNDKNLRFLPKIFYESRTETGEINVILAKGQEFNTK